VLFPVVVLFLVWTAAQNRVAAYYALATMKGDEMPTPAKVGEGAAAGAATPSLGNAVTKAMEGLTK
jgi:hypothetical protein